MFGTVGGQVHTYFAESPVVITVSGLTWPGTSPFNIVRVEVLYGGVKVGEFRADTGGQSSISFDISQALHAIWADYTFSDEVAVANSRSGSVLRPCRAYSLVVYQQYLASQDNEFTEINSGTITGGLCAIGWLTEMERSTASTPANADITYRQDSNLRNGNASTKPTSSPERVGSLSLTSWVGVQSGQSNGTTSVFYPHTATPANDGASAHAPIVLRDDIPYADFLFVNRRGAVETCSADTLESLGISVKSQKYGRVSRPSFVPTRTLTAKATGGRRSWPMSSGAQTREWAEWWALEFLMARQWWMRYPIGDPNGTYVPVIVEPAKENTTIYDRTKQQMPSVEFTVTMALEG